MLLKYNESSKPLALTTYKAYKETRGLELVSLLIFSLHCYILTKFHFLVAFAS